MVKVGVLTVTKWPSLLHHFKLVIDGSFTLSKFVSKAVVTATRNSHVSVTAVPDLATLSNVTKK